MRGKGGPNHVQRTKEGITPAHAGKRRTSRAFVLLTRDHPRACGEKPYSLNRPPDGSGSPPRMRGKAVSAVVQLFGDRITPAHAGKRSVCLRLKWPPSHHPRACGEKVCALGLWALSKGSPPRMRGKAPQETVDSEEERITPAHAGKSHFAVVRVGWHEDHPRACGEKKLVGKIAGMCVGSPPRMRGKVSVMRC